MDESQQTVIRWQPLADMPETPCADFTLESSSLRQVTLTLKYSQIVGNDDRDLILAFSDVLAFRVHWDRDRPVVGGIIDAPRCAGGRFSGFVWPVLIVENSQWLASGDFGVSVFIAAQEIREPWRQFTVATLERSADILARGAVRAEWVTAKVTRAPSVSG